jgi:hypothetical protein
MPGSFENVSSVDAAHADTDAESPLTEDPAVRSPANCLVRLPGHPPLNGWVSMTYRTRGERLTRCFVVLLLWPPACLVAAFIPPHGEPLALAFFGGMYLIYRSWTTAYVVRVLDATCPRCRQPLNLKPNARLSTALEIPCYSCHFHPVLDLRSPPPDATAR